MTLLTGEGGQGTVPVFASPEEAVRVLARAADYAAFRDRPDPVIVEPDDIDLAAARAVIRDAFVARPEGGWLEPTEVMRLLRCFGLPVAETRAVASAASAAAAAEAVGFPVALKAAGPEVVHKSDVGGVRLGLADADSVRSAYAQMQQAVGPAMIGAVVQPMASPGVETIVGVVQDPSFGPLVMFGLGGTAAELLADRAFRILPVGPPDAAELVRSIRTAPLLFGYRGSPPTDTAALEDLLVRVGALAQDLPEVEELDLNPVVVNEEGAVVVDARIRLAPSTPVPPDVRRLRAPG
jgi:acyl-CoA synthetase (NDP forming)